MTITAPNSEEWVKDGKVTPVFIQYLDQFKVWINERQATLDAEANVVAEAEEEALKKANLPAHEMESLESVWYDPGGSNYSFWQTAQADLAVGPYSVNNVSHMYNVWAETGHEIYYRVNELYERQDALEAALVASGQLEIR